MAVDEHRFAQVYKHGDSEKGIEPFNLQKSMIEAGYAKSSTLKGRAGLSQKCLDALIAEGITFAKKFTPQDRADFVRGRLMRNAALGEDKGVKSLELLGKDKEVGLFTPDSQIGVIILQAPPELNVVAPIKEPPMIAAPVDVVEVQ